MMNSSFELKLWTLISNFNFKYNVKLNFELEFGTQILNQNFELKLSDFFQFLTMLKIFSHTIVVSTRITPTVFFSMCCALKSITEHSGSFCRFATCSHIFLYIDSRSAIDNVHTMPIAMYTTLVLFLLTFWRFFSKSISLKPSIWKRPAFTKLQSHESV